MSAKKQELKVRLGIFLLLSVSLYYVYALVLRSLPAVMMDYIITNFNVNNTSAGLYAGVYYVGYALAHIPIGILVERVCIKKIYSWCALFMGISLLSLLSSNWYVALIGRTFLGVFSAMSAIGSVKVLSIAFPGRHCAFAIGLMITLASVAVKFTLPLINQMTKEHNWESFILLSSSFAIVVVIGMILTIPAESRKIERAHEKSLARGMLGMLVDMKLVLKDPKVLLPSIFGAFMIGPFEGFGDAWITPFLVDVHSFTYSDALSSIGTLYIGFAFGAPLLGYISARTKEDIMVLLGCAVLSIIAFAALLFSPNLSTNLVSVFIFALGFASGYQTIIVTGCGNVVKNELSGLAVAISNMFIMAFGFVIHVAIGLIFDSKKHSPDMDAAHVFSLACSPILIFLFFSALGFLWLYFKWERNPKTKWIRVDL